MQTFVYESLPSRVIFGSGSLGHLNDELKLLGLGRGVA
jgi:hypothetical protein